MKSRYRLGVAAALLLALAPIASVSAQEPPADIQGSYLVSGALTVDDCTFEGGPQLNTPFSAYLTITDQQGSSFLGTLGFPEQQAYIISLGGHVSPDGLIEGTWDFSQGGDQGYQDQVFTGEIVDGRAEITFTAAIVVEDVSCGYRIALSSEAALLSWSPPDPEAATELPPPRALTIGPPATNPPGGGTDGKSAEPASARRAGEVTGYKVYRSNTPNVDPTPENLFATVPPTQTSAPTPVGSSGSFFVVTATYDEGESEPSNEVSGGVDAATLGPVKVLAGKIKATGTGFSSTVQVFVDGIPFASSAKVKSGGRKVLQKGALLTGQTLAQYITSGKTVAITFRNENGGVATYVYTKP